MIARSTNRGLGIQTWEVYRHLEPERTLVIDHPNDPYDRHPERFPDARTVRMAELDEDAMAWLCDGVDVIYSAETFYSDLVPERARELGARTVMHGNFEFLRWIAHPDLVRPDAFWAPSTWQLARWPEDTRLMLMPVASDRFTPRERTGARRFLHLAGHPAMADRAGTRMVLRALRYVREKVEIIIRSQQPLRRPGASPNVTVRMEIGDRGEYWEPYDEADVLLFMRRFGGLSLPLNEGLAAGLAIIAMDVEPQAEFLHHSGLIPARAVRHLRTAGGVIPTYDALPRALASKIDQLARGPELVQKMSQHSLAYAHRISWGEQLPTWRKALEDVSE